MPTYSHSKIQTFEQCPYKFKLKYIDKIKPDIDATIEAILGTASHDTLEWLYSRVLKNEGVPSIDDVITYYTEKWQSLYHDEIPIVKEGMTSKDYFNKGVQFLLDYYNTHYPFDENTLELEKQIFIKLDDAGNYKFRGFIDRLVYNKETGEYEIHDYKTSNSLPDKEKIEKDRQLALYSLAIKDLYGHDNGICLVWHYLNFNKKICSKRTNEQLYKLKEDTLEKIKQIESTNYFPPYKSILCNWCEYQHTCPTTHQLGGHSCNAPSFHRNQQKQLQTKESNGDSREENEEQKLNDMKELSEETGGNKM